MYTLGTLGSPMENTWVGWGGDNNKRDQTCLLLRHLLFSCIWCYAAWSSLAFDAAPLDLLLHLMLRRLMISGIWCCATWSSLAFDATPHDLLLHLMLRHLIFSGIWCYATWSSLAFAHETVAKLGETRMSSWNSKRISCGGRQQLCWSNYFSDQKAVAQTWPRFGFKWFNGTSQCFGRPPREQKTQFSLRWSASES